MTTQNQMIVLASRPKGEVTPQNFRLQEATLPDLALEAPTEADIHVVRRVSAAFQEVAGGQWLVFNDDVSGAAGPE